MLRAGESSLWNGVIPHPYSAFGTYEPNAQTSKVSGFSFQLLETVFADSWFAHRSLLFNLSILSSIIFLKCFVSCFETYVDVQPKTAAISTIVLFGSLLNSLNTLATDGLLYFFASTVVFIQLNPASLCYCVDCHRTHLLRLDKTILFQSGNTP